MSAPHITHVVFDIGGVLVDWQPHLAFEPTLGSRAAAEDFMTRVGFRARNTRADGGASFADLAAEIEDADDRAILETYVPNYALCVQEALHETWAILDRLHAAGLRIGAITNWSHETWPEGLKSQPRLAEAFGTLVVSGREGVMKPAPEIFHIYCERAGAAPENCLFIDDGLHNVEGARAIGMAGHHFTGAAPLERALTERGLL